MDVTDLMSAGAYELLGPDESVVVARTPEGRVVVLPRSRMKLTGAQAEIAAQLEQQAESVRQSQQQILELVQEGRENGLSWHVIGWCIGVTEGAVRKMVQAAQDREEDF